MEEYRDSKGKLVIYVAIKVYILHKAGVLFSVNDAINLHAARISWHGISDCLLPPETYN
jgi:hypothetical protein